MYLVQLGSLFCLSRLCERRLCSPTSKFVASFVICSQKTSFWRLKRMVRMFPSGLRLTDFFPKILKIKDPLHHGVHGEGATSFTKLRMRSFYLKWEDVYFSSFPSPPSFLRFWNHSKTMTRSKEKFETPTVCNYQILSQVNLLKKFIFFFSFLNFSE